jgi:flavodoxin
MALNLYDTFCEKTNDPIERISSMKTLIVYSSKTGNTKKLAESVSDMIGGEKSLCPVSEAPDPAGYDLVVLGFWLKAGKPDPASSDYLAGVGDSRLFLFATHAAAVDSAHAEKAMEHAKSLCPSAQIAGTFNCPGEVDPVFLEKAYKKDPPPPWIGDAPAAAGHPDSTDIARLIESVKAALPEFTV